MLKVGLALAVAFLQSVIKRAANATWDELWGYVFSLVGEVEKKYKEGDMGEVKKREVLELAGKWLKEQRLSRFQIWIAKLLIGKVIDAIVSELNETLGKDWVETAKEVEARLAEWLPVIE